MANYVEQYKQQWVREIIANNLGIFNEDVDDKQIDQACRHNTIYDYHFHEIPIVSGTTNRTIIVLLDKKNQWVQSITVTPPTN